MKTNERYTVTYLKLLVQGDSFRFEKMDLLNTVDFMSSQGATVFNPVTRQSIFYTKAFANKLKVLKILKS